MRASLKVPPRYGSIFIETVHVDLSIQMGVWRHCDKFTFIGPKVDPSSSRGASAAFSSHHAHPSRLSSSIGVPSNLRSTAIHSNSDVPLGDHIGARSVSSTSVVTKGVGGQP